MTPSEDLHITLTDLAHLFNAAPVDPHSPAPSEVMGISGFDLLVDVLHVDKAKQHARALVIHLPADKAAATSLQQTKDAVQRVAAMRIKREHWERRGAYRDGWRMTVAAVVLLTLCLAVSSLFGSDLTEGIRPLLRRTFEYGFEIVGWVILSYPLDYLILKPMVSWQRSKVFAALERMPVQIVSDG